MYFEVGDTVCFKYDYSIRGYVDVCAIPFGVPSIIVKNQKSETLNGWISESDFIPSVIVMIEKNRKHTLRDINFDT